MISVSESTTTVACPRVDNSKNKVANYVKKAVNCIGIFHINYSFVWAYIGIQIVLYAIDPEKYKTSTDTVTGYE